MAQFNNLLQDRLDAMLTPEDRRRIETQKKLARYFKTSRDKDLDHHFSSLVRRAATPHGRLQEMRALLLVGNTGAGKSTALDRLFRSRFSDFKEPGCPMVSVSMPSPATQRLWGHVILRALGYPITRILREAEVWDLVMTRLKSGETCFLHVDEMQHVTRHANVIEMPKILDTLKVILDQAKVGLVLSGLPQLVPFWESDPQVKRRTLYVKFSPLTPDEDMGLVVRMIGDLAVLVDLAVEDSRDIAARLIHAGAGQFGQIVNYAQSAIEEAVLGGDSSVTRQHFALVYARDTGNSAPNNPFVADRWHEVDVKRVLDSVEHDNGADAEMTTLKILQRPSGRRKK